jgi:hypothetical protein
MKATIEVLEPFLGDGAGDGATIVMPFSGRFAYEINKNTISV